MLALYLVMRLREPVTASSSQPERCRRNQGESNIHQTVHHGLAVGGTKQCTAGVRPLGVRRERCTEGVRPLVYGGRTVYGGVYGCSVYGGEQCTAGVQPLVYGRCWTVYGR